MIHVRDLVKIAGGARILDGATLEVKTGRVGAVIGPSGGGKSTLLRCINGLERFDQGSISVAGITLDARGAIGGGRIEVLRRRVGMVFQQFHLFANMDVLENVMSGPRFVLGLSEGEAEERARALLRRVHLAGKERSELEALSGGQQQRVAIARALAVEPEVLLLDEPTSALDPALSGEVSEVIAELARAGQTMVVVTHELRLVERIADVVHVVSAGRVVESAPPAELFGGRAAHPATQALLAQAA